MEQFKVGDLVRILSNKRRGRCPIGSVCEVKTVDTRDCSVFTPDKSDFWYYPHQDLCPVSAATLTPGQYTATVGEDGQITLTPLPVETVAEAPREPKRGEVWLGASYWLRDSANGWVCIEPAACPDESVGYRSLNARDLIYAYPSLSAAITAGAIK